MTNGLAIALCALLATACSPTTTAAPTRSSSLPPGPADLIVPPEDDVPVRGSTGGAECVNSGLDQFKGREATSATGTEMLRVSRARTIRWARPGMMMTMEFSPERLTVHLDSANRVTRAICG